MTASAKRAPSRAHPVAALRAIERIVAETAGHPLAIFLDYDGTLAPIARTPSQARLPARTRRTLGALAECCPVAIVSGRGREDVAGLVGLDNLYYVGSHGFDIAGPHGHRIRNRRGQEYVPILKRAAKALERRLAHIDGVMVENKVFAVAVHFRLAAEEDVPEIEAAVRGVVGQFRRLRRTGGKKVFELRPRMDWHKGKAVLWLLHELHLGPKAVPLYIGDDKTDEDAFRAIKDRGISIYVGHRGEPTEADYRLDDTQSVEAFLRRLTALIAQRREDDSGDRAAR